MQKFLNNWSSTTTSSLTTSSTTLGIQSGDASLLTFTNSEYYLLTLISYNSLGKESGYEIVKAVSKSGSTLTIIRAQDSTTAKVWPSSSIIQMRITASGLNDIESTLINSISSGEGIDLVKTESSLTISSTYKSKNVTNVSTDFSVDPTVSETYFLSPSSDIMIMDSLSSGDDVSIILKQGYIPNNIVFPSGVKWTNDTDSSTYKLSNSLSKIDLWKVNNILMGSIISFEGTEYMAFLYLENSQYKVSYSNVNSTIKFTIVLTGVTYDNLPYISLSEDKQWIFVMIDNETPSKSLLINTTTQEIHSVTAGGVSAGASVVYPELRNGYIYGFDSIGLYKVDYTTQTREDIPLTINTPQCLSVYGNTLVLNYNTITANNGTILDSNVVYNLTTLATEDRFPLPSGYVENDGTLNPASPYASAGKFSKDGSKYALFAKYRVDGTADYDYLCTIYNADKTIDFNIVLPTVPSSGFYFSPVWSQDGSKVGILYEGSDPTGVIIDRIIQQAVEFTISGLAAYTGYTMAITNSGIPIISTLNDSTVFQSTSVLGSWVPNSSNTPYFSVAIGN